MKSLLVLICFAVTLVSSLAFAQVPPETPTETPAATPEPAKKENPELKFDDMGPPPWRFGLGLGMSMGSGLGFRDVKTSGGAAGGKTDWYLSESFSLIATVTKLQPYQFGFIGGLWFDGEHYIDGGEQTINNVTTKLTDNKDNMRVQVQSAFASGAYHWRNWYATAGFNYSQVTLTTAKGFTGSLDGKSGLGLQLGAGVVLNENFHVEGTWRMLRLDLTETSAGGVKTEYGASLISIPTAALNYYF